MDTDERHHDDAHLDPLALFGQPLKELRRARGISQEELALRAELDRTYVSGCERGKRNVSLKNIYRLARALNIEPWELLRPGDRDSP